MNRLHRHVWKVVQRDEQPSAIESMVKSGSKYEMEAGSPRQVLKLTTRPVVVTYQCHCGSEKVERV